MASEQKRLFLALSLSALVLFTWQAYFAPKNAFKPEKEAKTMTSKGKSSSESNDGSLPIAQTDVSVNDSSNPAVPTAEDKPKESQKASQVTLVNGDQSLSLSSQLSLKRFESNLANDKFDQVVGAERPLQFFVVENGRAQTINLSEFNVSGNQVSGVDKERGVQFRGELTEDGLFRWTLSSEQPRQFYFLSHSEKKEGEARQIRQFLSLFQDVDRSDIDDEETLDGKMKWFGIDFHYHLFANVLESESVSAVRIKNEKMGVKLVEPTKSLSGYTIFTKKNYDDLNALGDKLHLSVDFGVFGIIAVPILKGLQFFYKYIPNYGFAIILITLLIRTLLFPLQYKSFKSMKKMQKLQPELAKVKEKYGDDPQRMQKETMELFKRNGANPMGGCLPLVLQMPVFFAFYQVLFNSVELLGAPFILWINDLSAKDPYYVLPVLMGIAMFGQTKLNPSTTADPTQQKMMMFMPLIFTFFMKDLPAGLNLYIFVSTLFGIAQQLFVYKTVD